MKILIVDDYAPFAESLRTALKHQHTVEIASTGAAALGLLRGGGFDAAFVDLKLPDMTGVEVCEAIQSEGISPPQGVVIVTGGPTDQKLWASLTRLKLKVIEKPFTPDELFALLSEP